MQGVHAEEGPSHCCHGRSVATLRMAGGQVRAGEAAPCTQGGGQQSWYLTLQPAAGVFRPCHAYCHLLLAQSHAQLDRAHLPAAQLPRSAQPHASGGGGRSRCRSRCGGLGAACQPGLQCLNQGRAAPEQEEGDDRNCMGWCAEGAEHLGQ